MPTTLYVCLWCLMALPMCADWMNGDVRVTKVIDELYSMYSSSNVVAAMSAMIRSKQLSRSSVRLAYSWPCDHRQDSTPPIQSLLPPFTLLSKIRLGHTDF